MCLRHIPFLLSLDGGIGCLEDKLVNAVPVSALPYELIFQLHKAM